MIGVPGVDEDLIVLLEPGVHQLPVEGDKTGNVGAAGGGIEVSPGDVLDGPAIDRDRVIGRVTLGG